jgi:hypothetical protein
MRIIDVEGHGVPLVKVDTEGRVRINTASHEKYPFCQEVARDLDRAYEAADWSLASPPFRV